jgi:hypothetical protein
MSTDTVTVSQTLSKEVSLPTDTVAPTLSKEISVPSDTVAPTLSKEVKFPTDTVSQTLSKEVRLPSDTHIAIVSDTVYSGTKFNELTNGRVFIKLTNKTDTHYDFDYVTGLNCLSEKEAFQPNNSTNKGGLYFTEALYARENMKSSYTFFRFVTIPSDAKIYVNGTKYKADKIIVGEKYPLKNEGTGIEQYYTLEQLTEIVSKNKSMMSKVKEITIDLCKRIINSDLYDLKAIQELNAKKEFFSELTEDEITKIFNKIVHVGMNELDGAVGEQIVEDIMKNTVLPSNQILKLAITRSPRILNSMIGIRLNKLFTDDELIAIIKSGYFDRRSYLYTFIKKIHVMSPLILKAFYEVMFGSMNYAPVEIKSLDKNLDKIFTEDEMILIVDNLESIDIAKFIFENYKSDSLKIKKKICMKYPSYIHTLPDNELEIIFTPRELIQMIKQSKK